MVWDETSQQRCSRCAPKLTIHIWQSKGDERLPRNQHVNLTLHSASPAIARNQDCGPHLFSIGGTIVLRSCWYWKIETVLVLNEVACWENFFNEFMTSDRKLEACRKGSKWRIYRTWKAWRYTMHKIDGVNQVDFWWEGRINLNFDERVVSSWLLMRGSRSSVWTLNSRIVGQPGCSSAGPPGLDCHQSNRGECSSSSVLLSA